jgi:serine/threonine-protein kinase
MTSALLRPNDTDAGAPTAEPRCGVSPGQLVAGKYRVLAKLAEGGIGVVFRACHLELDSPVALKVVRSEHAANEDVVTRLLSEARIAANLRSRHVNRVLDLGRTESGLPYLVLEHMEGSDLSSCLDRCGPLAPREVVGYVMQACEALAEAHALGIVHRDLKPANLFLSEEADGGFVLKVLDFGISKAPAAWSAGRRLSNPLEIVGSPNYMAPEQVMGENVDQRADIWALGVVLHELCSGQLPFDAPTITETFALIVDGRRLPALPQLGEASAGLDAVIARCLARDPNARYQSVVELAEALAPFGQDPDQASRVARVASASRARVIASRDSDIEVSEVTPIALATDQGATRRIGPRSAGLGRAATAAIAAMTLAAVAAAFVPPMAGGSERVVAAPSMPAPQPEAPLAAAPPSLPPPAVPAPSVVSPPAALASARPLAMRRAPARAKWQKPEPGPSAEAPAAEVTNAAPPDAWNPKSFGGRR